MKALLRLKELYKLWNVSRARPAGVWNFPVMIRQILIVPLSVDYNDVYISHAIENNLHKQQCIIGLPRTRKYNALLNIIHIVCLQALMNVGYVVCTHHISSWTWLGCSSKRSTYSSKEPQ